MLGFPTLRKHLCLLSFVSGGILSLELQAQPSPSPLNAMAHGPFVSSTISTDPLSTRSIFVYKGIAVRVRKERDAVMVFDTDLLRMASAWTGGFLKWYPARDGLQEFPSPDGYEHFTTSQRPGWSLDGRFGDPRPWRYGPVPSRLGRYKGLYLKGDSVVFSYTIGSTPILESPGFRRINEQPVFTRTFNLSQTGDQPSIQLARAPDGSATSLSDHKTYSDSGYVTIQISSHNRLVGYRGLPVGARWRLANHHLILDLPPLAEPTRFEVAIGPVLADGTADYLDAYLEASAPVASLSDL